MGKSCHADIRFVYVTPRVINTDSQAPGHILIATDTRDKAEKTRGIDGFAPPVANLTND